MLNRTPFVITGLLVAAGAMAPDIAVAQDDLAAQYRQCEQELHEASEAVGQAMAARDLDRFMAPFLEDAVQVNTLGEVFDGKAAVTDFYRAVMASNYTISFDLVSRVVDRCSSAIVVDRVEFTIPAAGIKLHAIDVAIWVRVQGQWRLRADTTTRIANP
ncbi:MAG TPA: nuclear transport factor 2 family protein [Lysobacter sp.]